MSTASWELRGQQFRGRRRVVRGRSPVRVARRRRSWTPAVSGSRPCPSPASPPREPPRRRGDGTSCPRLTAAFSLAQPRSGTACSSSHGVSPPSFDEEWRLLSAVAGRSDEERAKCDSTLLLPTFLEAAAVREGGEGGFSMMREGVQRAGRSPGNREAKRAGRTRGSGRSCTR